ncbi:MAG: dihydroorotate dehydrogenase [Myxococcota bacterium]
MALNLNTSLSGQTLKNPLMTASGTSGHSTQLSNYFPLEKLGAFVTKGVSIKAKIGNKPPRICETPAGLINCIGLENPGIKFFKENYLPQFPGETLPLIVNFFGNSIDTYVKAAESLGQIKEIFALELNISCPNVQKGGISFGSEPKAARALVEKCVKASRGKPVYVKLSPAFSNFLETACQVMQAGAAGLTCFNTYPATDINIQKRTFKLSLGQGGLSGPAILPLSLLKLHKIHTHFPEVELIASGGINTAEDIIKYILAGATAIQLGTSILVNPSSPSVMLENLESLCIEMGINNLMNLKGKVKGTK